MIDDRKEWWSQAETLVGALNAYHVTSRPAFLGAALRSWDLQCVPRLTCPGDNAIIPCRWRTGSARSWAVARKLEHVR